MSSKSIIGLGLGGFLLLLAASIWMLLRPPAGSASSSGMLKASSPALNVEYSYDPAFFKPAAYQEDAEFPLRLDAQDWSLYGKRLHGAAAWLKEETREQDYALITSGYVAEYSEFYKLEQEAKSELARVQLGRATAVRQSLLLRRGQRSLGWPSYFPVSVTAGDFYRLLPVDERAEQAFRVPGFTDRESDDGPAQALDQALLYCWTLLHGKDVFIFQAVAPRELDSLELQRIERLLGSLSFDALRAAGGSQ